jgi:RND family efflux transporter MFP subunit
MGATNPVAAFARAKVPLSKARRLFNNAKSFAAMGGALLTLAACDDKNAYVPPPPAKVVVAQPLKQPVTRYVEFTGNTQAFNQVDLEARVQGYLEKINYKDGTLQKKGTVLFEIQQNTYKAQLDQAKASVVGAQAELKKSQAEFERQADLQSKQVSTQANYDKALAQRDQDQATLLQAQANSAIAEINLGYTTVTAPYDGVVTRHLVGVGSLVGYSGPTKLATIVQVAPIYVYFNASETLVLRIKEELAKQGKTLRDLPEVPVEIGLQIETGYPHEGRLDYVSPNVDPHARGARHLRQHRFELAARPVRAGANSGSEAGQCAARGRDRARLEPDRPVPAGARQGQRRRAASGEGRSVGRGLACHRVRDQRRRLGGHARDSACHSRQQGRSRQAEDGGCR